jgi:hypothetical protein
VLANGRCDVLKGQCLRSNAGLFYDNYGEFVEALRALEQNRWLTESLGRNGKQYFRENYDWPVIVRKYRDMLGQLAKGQPSEPMPGQPGWLDRRRRDLPPAEDVLAGLPIGPAPFGEVDRMRRGA